MVYCQIQLWNAVGFLRVHVGESFRSLSVALIFCFGLAAFIALAWLLKRVAAMPSDRRRTIHAGVAAPLALILYAGAAVWSIVLRYGSIWDINRFFQGHLFDALALTTLVALGWRVAPVTVARPGRWRRAAAYAYFAAAAAAIAAVAAYMAEANIAVVLFEAIVAALVGLTFAWLLLWGARQGWVAHLAGRGRWFYAWISLSAVAFLLASTAASQNGAGTVATWAAGSGALQVLWSAMALIWITCDPQGALAHARRYILRTRPSHGRTQP